MSVPENIDLCLEALPQTQVIRAHLKPAPGLLVEVQPPTDLDDPAGVEPDFAVVQVRVQLHFQFDIQFQQALLQLLQLFRDFGELRLVVVAGDQLDLLDATHLQKSLAEADEILDLMLHSDVRVFDGYRLRALQI